MDDLISRQAAIDAMEQAKEQYFDRRVIIGKMQDIVNNLPSAQTERKKGKWIIRDNPGTGWYRVTCSECGKDVTSTVPVIVCFPSAKVLWEYCPWCGADMRGETDG